MKKAHTDILRLAVPSIVSNITVPLLGMIDLAITGHLGNQSFIGAIAVGSMLFNIMYWMFGFLRMGTSGLTAQAFGETNKEKITETLYQGITVSVAISLLLLVLSPLIFMGAMEFIAPSPEVRELVGKYFRICVAGIPASLLLFVFNGWYIGMQNTRIPMAIAISQNILNIFASLFFVYGIGMELEGIALGTVIAQWGGALASMFLLRKRYGEYVRQSYSIKKTVLNSNLSRYLLVNRDIFLRTLCLIGIHFYFIAAGAKGGDTILAVNAVFMQFFTLYSYFIDGMAYAGEALVGKAVGARDKEEYGKTLRGLFLLSGFLTFLFTLVYAFFNTDLLTFFTDNEEVLKTSNDYLLWTLFFPICGMAAFIWDGVYIGATLPRYMLLSTLSGIIVFFALYLALYPKFDNHALWLAFLSNLVVRGVILTVFKDKVERRVEQGFK